MSKVSNLQITTASTIQAILPLLDAAGASEWEVAIQLGYAAPDKYDLNGQLVFAGIRKARPTYDRHKLYRLAKAGRCYVHLLKYDEELAQRVFDGLYISHLYSVWAAVENDTITPQAAFELLQTALEENMDATALKELIPTKNGTEVGGWNLKARKAIPVLRGLVEDETLGADTKHIHRALRVGKLFLAILERMTQ